MPKDWKTTLEKSLNDTFGKTAGAKLYERYHQAFPENYYSENTLETAINDIRDIEALTDSTSFHIQCYQLPKSEFPFRVRLVQRGKLMPLSDILPLLENMDLRTIMEQSYALTVANGKIWINEYQTVYAQPTTSLHFDKKNIEEALTQLILGTLENDGFNKLILGAGLTPQEITLLRAYAKYLQQIQFRFHQSVIEKTFVAYPTVACDLVNYFKLRFNPKKDTTVESSALEKKIIQSLESITRLEDDCIVRQYLALINATVRTNFFQNKSYLALKLQSALVPELPLPHPMYEIFVYAPRFEAIHLRNRKVARGGIRWSDRREDFRTEVLGLMKTQVVKNAAIVPSGSKGGFVLKQQNSREEAIACYQLFIRGLLDLTDNIKNGRISHPHNLVCHDDMDPYLVVAADKGTATFSDIANAISNEYEFWLGDAFASGGAKGYNHKQIGITARGAWESIKRHFVELNIDMKKSDFSMIGIGDMSGDVFGNGLIYSDRIRLLAAFDHRDIFIDPNPDTKQSFAERKRLFQLPTSSWQDYNTKLISKGGGVFKRSAKSIVITPEMKKAFDIRQEALTPNELIRALLKAPVDVLYNGGIGTYVKGSTESQESVGDKTNEYCRVNGNELRCKIVAEGGNLGFTPLGRVEYALTGGLINTDFIDNSAGVDCSDHEVNIKILFAKAIEEKKFTEKNRDALLTQLTDDVAKLVLKDNDEQAFAISYASTYSSKHFTALRSVLTELEKNIHLDRAVEFLPDDKKLLDRKSSGQSFSRPELAILFAYTKIYVKDEILKSTLPEDPYVRDIIFQAFPEALHKKFPNEIYAHYLHREIIATQLANRIVNEMGIAFVHMLHMETGVSIAAIVRAYMAAAMIFEVPQLQQLIRSLDFKVSFALQHELLHHMRRLLTLATRWFLRGNRLEGDMKNIIDYFSKNVRRLEKVIPDLISGVTKTYLGSLTEQFIKSGLSKEIAYKIATLRTVYTALNVIEFSKEHQCELMKAAEIYFAVGAQFNLVWFRDQIGSDTREGYWNALSRLSLRDELDNLQRKIAAIILCHDKKEMRTDKLMANYLQKHQTMFARWETLLNGLLANSDIDYAMFFVAIRQLNWLMD